MTRRRWFQPTLADLWHILTLAARATRPVAAPVVLPDGTIR